MTKETKRFTLRIPKDRKDQLKVCSVQTGVSLNALILQILREWAKQNPPEQDKDAS